MSERSAPLTLRKKLAFSFALLTLVLAVVMASAEIFARLRGFAPWTPSQDPTMRVWPHTFVKRDTDLGNAYQPGRYVVTLANGYTFRVTHGEDGLRITHPPSSVPDAASSRGIWIFGCSYTHGWSLNDEETYPWLLQERLPGYQVVNFGVGGYGTLQSFIQFRKALAERPAPELAVIAYGSFHDARSTLNRYRMKGITPPAGHVSVRLPCARIGDDGELAIFTVDADSYHPWPFQRYSAFVQFLEETANRRELLRVRSHQVSKAIVDEFKKLADRHGTRLVLAGIFRSPETADMLAYARREGIASVDLSVRDAPEFQNLPHDAHPNPEANRRFAARLAAYLSEQALVQRTPGEQERVEVDRP